jgi:branched-chain amino acid transport system substrate-binding protein
VRRLTPLVLAVVGLTLAGCGAAVHPGQRIPGRSLTVYFGGSLDGASSLAATSALNGARLALANAGGRVGRYRVVLKTLADSTVASDGWDPNQTTLIARQVVLDPTTVGYLGDFNSGASAISIPLLNRAGIPQISPGSTAVGLTSAGAGAAPGEPQKYYPTGVRTFARVVPTDATQGLALVAIQRAMDCRSTFVLHDGEVDGEDAALSFVLTARSGGLPIAGILPFKRQATNYIALAQSVAASGADCVLISAIDERSAVQLTKQLAAVLPDATIFAGNGLADSAFTNPAAGGIPASLDSRVIVLSAMLPLSKYPPRASRVMAQYTRRYGVPEPSAIFGYAAMQLMLGAISRATDRGHVQADRAKVLAALFSRRSWSTVLGQLRLNRSGDPSSERFGIYTLVGGQMKFMETAG